ncbi:VOC family protein [Kitasatospora sp. NPDC058965]|uniref:VOC family protein n=1 Tax=Kitasatospora sp. NPDC058965 TaxID=3346682 RepID=UPI00367AA155
MTNRLRAKQFHETPDLADWRVLGEGACAYFRTGSLALGARLLTALADLPGTSAGNPDVDVRQDGVTVRLITVDPDYYGLTEETVELARAVSATAAGLGLVADPAAVGTVQVTVDALDVPAVAAFWRALLGYDVRSGSPEDLIDPRRRGAPFYFQQLDAPRTERNCLHVDVWVPYDRAADRIAAALAAGGTLVSDAYAPGHWVLADPEGNEACVGTAGYPDARD